MYTKLNQTAEQIEAVLRDRHAAASVIGGKVLPGFVEMLLRPEGSTKVSQVKALQADIALAVGSSNVRIAQSGGNLAVQIGRQARQPVRLSALMPQVGDIPRFTAVLGLAEDGAPLLARITSAEVSHVLVAGTTGSGKTSLAQTILLSLCRLHKPHEIGLIVVDPKRRERDPFLAAVQRHLLLPVAQDAAQAGQALARLIGVLERRTIQNEPMPRIILYVDEMADLCQAGGADVVDKLTRIAQRGRESGIHLLACTQKPSSKAIGSLLKANLPLRLVGRVTSPEDARVASGIGGSGAERLSGAGDFIAVTAGRLVRFQAALPI